MSEAEFVECDTCRVKPGSPLLCSGCLENRRTISALRAIVSDLDKLLSAWKAVRNRRADATDEGVEEQTAGLPHNDPNEVAYLPG